MKAILKIKGKEYVVDLTEEQVKEIEIKKRWRAKFGDSYYCVINDGVTQTHFEANDVYDNYYYVIGNYFKTEEQAEEYKKKLLYTQQYKDWCMEKSEELDWTNPQQSKWYVFYDYSLGKIDFSYCVYAKYGGRIYASSKEIIQDFIKLIGEDNFKKYILEEDE